MKKTLTFLMGLAYLAPLTPAHAMDMEQNIDENTALHTVGAKLHEVIHASSRLTNNVHCPMGVNQTLALLHAIAEEKIQDEIVSLLGMPILQKISPI